MKTDYETDMEYSSKGLFAFVHWYVNMCTLLLLHCSLGFPLHFSSIIWGVGCPVPISTEWASDNIWVTVQLTEMWPVLSMVTHRPHGFEWQPQPQMWIESDVHVHTLLTSSFFTKHFSDCLHNIIMVRNMCISHLTFKQSFLSIVWTHNSMRNWLVSMYYDCVYRQRVNTVQ